MTRLLYPMPLSPEDQEDLYQQWKTLNPMQVEEIEQAALYINSLGKRVSTKYLVEKQRYESLTPIVGVPFTDIYGNVHEFKINNTHTPLIARDLLEKYPFLNIETRTSGHDK